MGKMTALGVKALTQPGRYQDGRGLMLLVKPSGSRSWQLRVQADGKRRDFGLGSANSVGLSEARTKADEIRKLYKSGVDPVAQRQAEKRAQILIPTFRVAAETAHAELVSGWRNVKHRADWLSSLERYAFGAIGDLRIDLIDGPMVRELLLPIWLEKPETARRVRQRVKGVLDWATTKGLRTSLDLSGLSKGLPRQPKSDNHFAAMDYENIPDFCATLKAAPETIGRLALLFTIYTAARSGETRGATWEEINLEAKQWTIPAERMKAGKEHIVPLSEPALAILKRMHEARTGIKSDPLFPGNLGKPLSDMTLSKILRDMELKVTVHGFRSSFKDWAVESTSFPDAVSEAALAHMDTNRVRAAYRRTDFLKMRVDLMAAWATHCGSAI
ncbi:tyrosine-type recombinase/integrase [Aquisediminimonas sediminicola]|uniref:tyrosine-type recombinase/integrase n=1 Tax=Alteraquisediminimonas sediminicola TaxID=2676787 RepID=UPI001C8EC9BD|nr:integrase arm-type DNA-binding domain-containing protein [Aquisediminimonas sediminicola]